jgi:hypothetical protein
VVADELGSVDPSEFTVVSAPRLLDRRGPARWASPEGRAPQRLPRELLR